MSSRAACIAAFCALPLLAQYGDLKRIASAADKRIHESSGVAASLAHPGIYWTVNDGGPPAIFAFDRTGKARGYWRVTKARCFDWEALAIGPDGQLYVGDIGDNLRRRKEIIVYRVKEPDPSRSSAATSPAIPIRLRYPDGSHDAEAMLVHPRTGAIYIVTKARGRDAETLVFRASPPFASGINNMELVAELNLPNQSAITLMTGRITDASISADGRSVILCDYFRAYESKLRGSRFDEIWKGPWTSMPLAGRAQGEAICYRADGKAIIATSEGKPMPLYEALRNP